MKKSLVGSFLVLLFVPMLRAQTRILVGPSGSANFDNSSVGVLAAIEIPLAKNHLELDARDVFSPFESHVALGGGYANRVSVGGFGWFSDHWGIDARGERSSYDVTQVSKAAYYGIGGFAYRRIVGGFPARFTFNYIRQFNTGITPSGLESPQLQGGEFGFTVRLICASFFCVRLSEDIDVGVVKTQGNPYCDGSIGPQTCGSRGTAIGGGANTSVTFEFPRRKAIENDVF